jgi:hypothetical protein
MKDVAALADVSVGTASNVLNSPDLVSPRHCGQGARRRSASSAGSAANRPASAGRAELVDRVRVELDRKAAQLLFAETAADHEDTRHVHEQSVFTSDQAVRRSTARADDRKTG